MLINRFFAKPSISGVVLCAVLLFQLVLGGCSSSSTTEPTTTTDNGPWAPNTQTYNVTYTPETILFDSTAVLAIRSSDTTIAPASNDNEDDTTNIVYHFDASSDKAQQIQEGSILLLYGQSIRRVLSVETSGDEIVVATTEANLNDAVQDGDIAWDYGFDFNPNSKILHPSIVMPQTGKRVPMIPTSDGFKISFPVGDYKGTIEMKLQNTNAAVTVELDKSIGKANAKLMAVGTIERFRSKSDMHYQNKELKQYHYSNPGVKGDLTLSAEIAASGNDYLPGVDLPVVLLEVPYLVGPILVQLKVSCRFVIQCVVPLDGSANLSSRFTYNSDLGFKYEGSDVEASGQIGTIKMEKNKTDVAASGDIGVNFGIDMPKISVDIMHKSVVAYAMTGVLINGDFTFNPACARAQGAYVGAVGYSLSFLGLVDIAKGSKTLFQQQSVFKKVGNCPN